MMGENVSHNHTHGVLFRIAKLPTIVCVCVCVGESVEGGRAREQIGREQKGKKSLRD
jgi:hypothetical protein